MKTCNPVLFLPCSGEEGALRLPAVHGEKSTSTVKAIHNSALPYLLGLLLIPSVHNRPQAKLMVLWRHELSSMFLTPYFFSCSVPPAWSAFPHMTNIRVILQTLPKCHLFYTFLTLSAWPEIPSRQAFIHWYVFTSFYAWLACGITSPFMTTTLF